MGVTSGNRIIIRASFIFFFLLPVIYLIIRSIAGIWPFPDLLPRTWSLRSLHYLLENRRTIGSSLLSSFAYSLATVLLSLLFSISPAHVLARRSFRGKTVVESLMLAPLLVPAIVFSLGLYPLLLRTGLIDTVLGVVLVLSIAVFPYMLRALTLGFESYEPGLEITATMLGAGVTRKMFSVHIPQLLPAILSGGTVVFLAAFTEYFLVFIIGGGIVPSFSGYLLPLLRSSDWGISAMLSLVFLILPIIMYSILDKILVRYYRKRKINIGGIT